MKLLLDENLSPAQAAVLRSVGYDAISVVEAGLSGSADEAVRLYSIETDRVLVTLDSDFANILRFPPQGTPGVIRLKVHPPTEDAIRERLAFALEALKGFALRDSLAVVHGSIIRVRK